jgi:hypothetical protein
MPLATTSRAVALVAVAALTDLRDGTRQVLAADGPVARAADVLVQAGINTYAVLSVAVWALALCITARRPCSHVMKDILG